MRESRRSQKEQAQQRMQQEENHYKRTGSLFKQNLSGVKFFKSKEGLHLFDILSYDAGQYDPIEKGSYAYVLRIFVHKNAAQDNSDIICIESTFKNKQRRDELFGEESFCPICREYRNRAANGGTKEELTALKPAGWPRTVYNIYDRRNPGDGAQVFETSSYLLQQYLDAISKRTLLPGETATLENYIPYMDSEEGKSVSFDRQGKEEKVKFIGIKFEDRRTPIPDEILNAVQPLDELIAWPTVESAYLAYWGISMDGKVPAGSRAASGAAERSNKYQEDVPEPEEPKAKPKEEPKAQTKQPDPEPSKSDDDDDDAELKALEAQLAAKKAKKEAEAKKKAESNKESSKEKVKEETKETGDGNKCPHDGVFGKDIDELPKCDSCEVWKDCAKENDRMSR